MIQQVRIEPQALNGQVIANLLPRLIVNRILIVDDRLYQSPEMRSALSRAIPAHHKVHIRSRERGLEALRQADASENRYLVILGGTRYALELARSDVQLGVPITCGQILHENGVPVTRGLALLPEEIEDLEGIVSAGTAVVFDLSADGSSTPWERMHGLMQKAQKRPSSSGSPSSAMKTFAILDLFLSEPGVSLTAQQIQEELGIPLSSTYRFLATLEKCGYLEKQPATKNYVLGWKFHKLLVTASAGTSSALFEREAPVVVDELVASSGESAAIFECRGDALHCLYHKNTSQPIAVNFNDQERVVDAKNPAGIAALSLKTNRELDFMRDLTREDRTLIEGCRETGIVTYRNLETQISGVASIVRSGSGVPSILTSQGPAFRLGEQELTALSRSVSAATKRLAAATRSTMLYGGARA